MNLKSIYRYVRIYILRLLSFAFAKKIQIEGKHVLIVAPHPDDEVFGCAGLIQDLLQQKKKVTILILTRGENSCPEYNPEEIKQKRTELAYEAANIIGVDGRDIVWGNFPDGKIKEQDPNDLLNIIQKINPDTIFIPHPQEGWSDHEHTQQYILKGVKKMNPSIKCFFYCVWFWFSMPYSKFTQVDWKQARIFLMSNSFYQKKIKAIDAYVKPLTNWGKPYSGDLPKEFIFANRWKVELYFISK